jgi:hypothetical protein
MRLIKVKTRGLMVKENTFKGSCLVMALAKYFHWGHVAQAFGRVTAKYEAVQGHGNPRRGPLDQTWRNYT